MNDVVWVGIRESEIENVDFINNSINIFGNNKNSLQNIYNVSINHNDYKNDKIIGEYYNNQIKNILLKDSNTKFMYYSQIYSYEDIKKGGNLDKVINLKDQKIIDFLNSKFESKAFFKEYVPVLDYEIKKGGSIDYKSYNTRFNCKRFVVQNDDSSGGFGTLLLDEQNYENLKLESNSNYMITKYCDENIPINTHVLISNDKIIIFPSSIQIIEVQNNRLTYKGCDFIAYKNIISDDINKKVRNYTNLIAKILKEKGYRGILGIDSIVYQNEVYFMEVNPRYQNSSTILNMGLKDSDLPSLQELEYKIFTNENINNIFDFDVNYSSYLIEEGDNNKSSDDFIKILDYNKKITNRYDGSYTCTKVYNKPIFNKKYTL